MTTQKKYQYIRLLLSKPIVMFTMAFVIIILTLALAYAIMFRSFEARYKDAKIKSETQNLIKKHR